MKEVKVVLGANYGDEGKGLVSAALARNATDYKGTLFGRKKVLTVLFNGGVQRGHTVETENFHHICHSIGAGAVYGNSDTFYNRHFMINPYIFLEETASLPLVGRTWVDPRCEITTPFDIMINRALEKHRSGNRHGSCGLGIFETFLRANAHYGLTYSDIKDFDHVVNLLNTLREVYYNDRINSLREEGVYFSPEFFNEYYSNETVLGFACALEEFKYKTYPAHLNSIVDYYDTIIYEGAQGLMLDMGNSEDWPHLTPSHTNSEWVIEEIKDSFKELQCTFDVYYVSRTYLTRHGAGPLKEENNPEEVLKKYILDKTNMPNPWQQTLRYAPLDSKRTKRFIEDDMWLWSPFEKKNFHLILTHWNELPQIDGVLTQFDPKVKIHISKTPYYTDLDI